MMEKILELVEYCRSHKVYIQTHNFPDMDAIASAFGLQGLLAHYGVPATLCYVGKIDSLSTRKMTELLNIEITSYSVLKEQMREEDAVICVDSQKLGGNIKDLVGDEVACIDHHPTYRQVAYRYADIRPVGSCATLIAEYYQKLNVPMRKDVATALLYGLKMDTAHFSRGVTPLDIEMFGYLFPQADVKKLADLEKNALESSDLKAIGYAIENIRVYDRVGFVSIPFSCPEALIATVADFILYIEEVEIAIVYSHRADDIKFSVRTEDPTIHAGRLVRRALKDVGDGGGHPEMAGGAIPKENLPALGSYPDDVIRDRFLQALETLKTL